MSSIFSLFQETLPEFLASLKKIREDPRYFEEADSKCNPSDDEEIEYEVDESFLKEKCEKILPTFLSVEVSKCLYIAAEAVVNFYGTEGAFEPPRDKKEDRNIAGNQEVIGEDSSDHDTEKILGPALENEGAKEGEKELANSGSATRKPEEEADAQIPAPLVENPDAKQTTTPTVPLRPMKEAAVKVWKTKLTQRDLMQKVRHFYFYSGMHF